VAETITAQQRAFVGKLWDRAHQHQCEALMWLGLRWNTTDMPTVCRLADHLLHLKWCDIGEVTQTDITRELLALLADYQKVTRT